MSHTNSSSQLMKTVKIAHIPVKVCAFKAVTVGSGAAGLAAAMHLERLGVRPAALITEAITAGTSRNTGSDKQTYYKLSLAGSRSDSVEEMAQTLFSGGCMDGDLARIEAALSAACFSRLCDMGIPFPRNEYGEAVGYKTDHDPRTRATSAGPLTSKLMTEALEKRVRAGQTQLLDGWQVIRILTEHNRKAVSGLLCLNRHPSNDQDNRYLLVLTRSVIWAVGGPAMLYADSVYPHSQYGATGLALEAGARVKNATEWQYGLASVKPRWNVSGSFQQVLPRYVSCQSDGSDPVDFLDQSIPDRGKQLAAIFRKGYEWPFDVRKMAGSSLIDMLVYQETVLRGRRVFLDFRENPGKQPIDFSSLDEEAASYLKKAGADQALPIERLRCLNQPAIDFYASHGIDLAAERLEIRLCAQHHNGGLAGDHNWESNLSGLYPVGEANGSHGIYRPGGSALNSGQAGAQRAAEAIWLKNKGRLESSQHLFADESLGDWTGTGCASLDDEKSVYKLPDESAVQAAGLISWLQRSAELCEKTGAVLCDRNPSQTNISYDVMSVIRQVQKRMSRYGGPFRSVQGLRQSLNQNQSDLNSIRQPVMIKSLSLLPDLCRCRDLLITEKVYLTAMLDYQETGGGSRGSFLCLDPDGVLPESFMPDFFRGRPVDLSKNDQIQEAFLTGAKAEGTTQARVHWRPVRKLPLPDDVFENVWRTYRQAYQLES